MELPPLRPVKSDSITVTSLQKNVLAGKYSFLPVISLFLLFARLFRNISQAHCHPRVPNMHSAIIFTALVGAAVAQSSTFATSTTQAPVTHTIGVGKGGHTMEPDVTLAEVGDIISKSHDNSSWTLRLTRHTRIRVLPNKSFSCQSRIWISLCSIRENCRC